MAELECDGGCSYGDGPQEECSAHGRTPKDLWGIIGEIAAERDAALSTIAKVEALHRPFEWSFGFGPVTSCKGCADQGVPQENASWPCPTIRALGSVPSTGEGNE